MGLIIAFIAVCGIGIGSSFFLGPDNPVEEQMEEAAKQLILIEIPGEEPQLVWLDFSPATPEKRNKYIEND